MIKRLLSIFGSKSEEKAAPQVKTRSLPTNNKAIKDLKKEIEKMHNQSSGLHEDLKRIKEQVGKLPDHSDSIKELHKRHELHDEQFENLNEKYDEHEEKFEKLDDKYDEHRQEINKQIEKAARLDNKIDAYERKLEMQAEKFSFVEGKLNDHRIDIVELKSRLNELNHSLARFEHLAVKVSELEKAREAEPEFRQAQRIATKVARASAPTGSLVEQYHSLSPNTKKIFSHLLAMHIEHKGKWVPLSDLRNRQYPGDQSNSTLAAMAKAIRPLYENGFVEKKRDKSFAYVAATKKGRDAAKEAGLLQQAEKFDAAFARLEE